MKYIITESRLDNLIMNFLDLQFKGMKKHHKDFPDGMVLWWEKNGERIMELAGFLSGDTKNITMGISPQILWLFERTFDLKSSEADVYIIEWVKKNLGLDVSEIYELD